MENKEGGFIGEGEEEGFLIELRRKIGNLALTLLMRLKGEFVSGAEITRLLD